MYLQGKVVEYIEHGRFHCALVLEDSGKRLRVLSQNGREANLPASRIIHESAGRHPLAGGRDELLHVLRHAAERRQSLMEQVNLAEIWELAQEADGEAFEPCFLTELWFGEEASDDQTAAFLRCIFEDKLYFRYKEGRIIAHAAEVVAQLRERQEKERVKEELLASGARGLQRLWQGEEPGDWPEREKCLALLRDYYLFGNEIPESELARELLKQAQLTRPHDPFQLLVKAGVWREDENIPLLRHQLPADFSPEALAAAAALAEPDPEALIAAGHRDLRALPLLTIDGESTRDYDDALHIEQQGENFLVGIHIADVAQFVKPGDRLYEEAVSRITSIYLPDRQIPMLPPALSEGVCSLIAGRPRAAMSFLVLLSPQGEVLDSSVVRSVIEVKRQLSYGQAEEMLSRDRELKQLAILSQQLRQRRIEAGALILPIPDVEISFGPSGEIGIRLAEQDTPTRTLVAEFMVLANSLGAQYVAERAVPGLFRSQEPPRKILIRGIEKSLLINFQQRRWLAPGKLGTSPLPHSGVGVMMYTTITSPIRRLLDLIMQHQIKGLLQGQGALFSGSELQELAGFITSGQGRVGQVRQLRQRYWILRYLEKHQGNQFQAVVLGRGPRKIQCLLTDFLLEGELPPHKVMPGEMVEVTVSRASALDNLLRLDW